MTSSLGNFLEDFQHNQVIEHAVPRTISEGDNSLYLALTGERYPLFCAHTFARDLGYPTSPVNDLLLFHIAFGRTVHDISLNAIANLGYAEIKFIRPVYPGDTLTSKSKVIGIKENSNKTTGIIYVHSSSFNQNKEKILSWKRWVMIPKRNKNAKINELLPNDIKLSVSVNQMHIPKFIKTNQLNYALTGSTKLWDDYEVNEVINHDRGLTIDETAHTLATHLYQNDAKLHFNAHIMKNTPFKKRLVYGGHIISLCRSLSFEGLENILLISAIHGGKHCNPTFSGDTLFTKTIVTAKDKIPGRSDLGVLKLKMIGIKNKTSESLQSIYQDNSYNKIYDPNVVLELDYSVVLPKGNYKCN
ncbi:MAG: MaoC family dehydratase [Methylophilaceae bacterium]